MKLSEHFTREELACRCGCGRIGRWPKRLKELVMRLEKLRRLSGDMHVKITSGYRCPKHNKAVGGVDGSYHTLDMAADVYIEGFDVRETALLAKAAGFKGIGRYFKQGFVHCDTGEKRTWDE